MGASSPELVLKKQHTSLLKKEMEVQVVGESLQNGHTCPGAYVLNSKLQPWCGLLSEGLNFHLVLGGAECKLFKATAHRAGTSL